MEDQLKSLFVQNKGSTESQGEEAGPHQLRPRLEASQPKNPNTSVHLLDATGTEVELLLETH